MDLFTRVADLCNEKGITIAALERKLDFGNGTIRKWGATTPSGDKLAKIADFFGVSIDYLLGRDSTCMPELDGIYFRFAKEAQDLKMDEEDLNNILNIYRKHQEKNK